MASVQPVYDGKPRWGTSVSWRAWGLGIAIEVEPFQLYIVIGPLLLGRYLR